MDPSLTLLIQTIINKQDHLEHKMDQGFKELNSFKWKIMGGAGVISGLISIVLIVYFN